MELAKINRQQGDEDKFAAALKNSLGGDGNVLEKIDNAFSGAEPLRSQIETNYKSLRNAIHGKMPSSIKRYFKRTTPETKPPTNTCRNLSIHCKHTASTLFRYSPFNRGIFKLKPP